ncbi:FxLD family lanthipeptide [Streptomyces sp. NPDC001833]|uniref:FxLD family lanthipeptide n=1 Tax=Streptomyces sp. NPDC001833 TaxID=3154658 RepID=UPI003326748B
MTTITLSPISVPPPATPPTEVSVAAGAVDVPTDPFDIDLTIITEVDSDLLPMACDTGDGCKPSCASSCASAV